MITIAHGNLLRADTEALVNTVNTVGVMGKGIALQFRRAYPDMFKEYARAAKAGEIQLGKMHVWETESLTGPRFVINFPTKRHWRSPSRLQDIESGLRDLVQVIRDRQIRSVAVPPLGCGHGGLRWLDVEPLIRKAFDALPDVDVQLYPPEATPSAADMPSRTKRPAMTPMRAAVIRLLKRYEDLALESSLIEVQKLCYLLQEAGEPLRLRFEKHHYGPYADNLRHALLTLEGHFLTGFGDGSSPVLDAEPLKLLPGSDEAADAVVIKHPTTVEHIDKVMELVSGFESMYGLELLGSVHWVATHEDAAAASNSDRAVELVQAWSRRKDRLFTEQHILAAWEALNEQGWLTAA